MTVPSLPSYQTPNFHVDVLAGLLTADEFVALAYITRRTLGFHKKADMIALSQFVDGITAKNGDILDEGTGLPRAACRMALNALKHYRVVLVGPKTNNGCLYELVLAVAEIDIAGLRARRDEKRAALRAQTNRARCKSSKGHPVDSTPSTDAMTGRSVDSMTGRSVDSMTGRSVDSMTGRSVDRTNNRTVPIEQGNTDIHVAPRSKRQVIEHNPDQPVLIDMPTVEAPSVPPPVKKSRKPVQHSPMVLALAEITQTDIPMATAASMILLNTTAKLLTEQGYDAPDVQAFGRWWTQNDWRGKQGQSPTLKQIRDGWGQFKKAQTGGNLNGTATTRNGRSTGTATATIGVGSAGRDGERERAKLAALEASV